MNAFNWQTGQPSIFAPLQKETNMVRKGPPPDAPIRTRRAVAAKPVQDWPKRDTTSIAKRINLDAVREFRLAGNSWNACAVKFGCTVKTLGRAIKKHHPELVGQQVVPHAFRRDLPNDELIAAVKAGETIRGMAKRLGVAHSTIHNRLRMLGMKPEGTSRTSIDDVAIAKEIMAGESLRAAALRRGLARATVERRLLKTKHGREALAEIGRRKILRCNAGHPFGGTRILTKSEIEKSNAIRGARI